MKKHICLLLFLSIHFISAQTKSSDYFCLYKGGEKYLKPVKYLMFDSSKNDNIKTENNGQTYFQIKNERFKFDLKKDKTTSYSIDFLDKIKLENPDKLENDAYNFFKSKKEQVEKKNKIKLIYPLAGFHSYFKIYILEKMDKNKIIKYEVNWENSTF